MKLSTVLIHSVINYPLPLYLQGGGLTFENIISNESPDTTTGEGLEQLPPLLGSQENGLPIFTNHQDPSPQTLLQSLENPPSSGEMSPGSEFHVLHTMPSDVIRHLNVDNDSTSTSPVTSPGVTSPVEPSVYSPDCALHDINTQHSLVERSEGLHLEDHLNTVDSSSTFWSIVGEGEEANNALKTNEQHEVEEVTDSGKEDPPSKEAEAEIAMFDAPVSGTVSSTQFVFTKFGSDVPIFTIGQQSKAADTVTSNVLSSR